MLLISHIIICILPKYITFFLILKHLPDLNTNPQFKELIKYTLNLKRKKGLMSRVFSLRERDLKSHFVCLYYSLTFKPFTYNFVYLLFKSFDAYLCINLSLFLFKKFPPSS